MVDRPDGARPAEAAAGGVLVSIARGAFVLFGVTATLVAGTNLVTSLQGAQRFDAVPYVGGVVVGLLALGAAAWVLSARPGRAAVAWVGIAAVGLMSLVPVWMLSRNPAPGADVISLAAVPTVIGLAATAIMARARIGKR